MAETQELNSILKSLPSAQELGNSRILTCDAEGQPMTLTRDKLVGDRAESTSASSGNVWTRVAKFGQGACGILSVTEGLWAGTPKGHVIAVATVYSDNATVPYVKQLLGAWARYRVLRDSEGDLLLDIQGYQKKQITVVSGYGITPMSVLNATTDGLETVIAEASLNAVNGGGKMLPLIALLSAERRAA